jgi:hypothetical protein
MAKKARSQTSKLLDLAKTVELFHTADNGLFAAVKVRKHLETYPVASGDFEQWLLGRFHKVYKVAPQPQALTTAIDTLKAKARFDGPELAVFVRVAELDSVIYLDLGDAEWRAVSIDRQGWKVVKNPPVRFRRPKGMSPLPEPERGGILEMLKQFVNISDEEWVLLVGWMLGALRPRGPYPILEIHGEQGSAKSTTSRMIRQLVDPNSTPIRSAPKDERDLMIAANNGWLLAFDNLSYITIGLSDALARLSTGGGFSTRKLYENDEEVLFNAQRPVLINGIEDLAERGDLLDRAVRLDLERIPDDKRRPEAELWAEFEAARPQMLGALLTTVSAALRNFDSTKLARAPRMADFAHWVTAAEEAIGWEPGTFVTAYERNRGDAQATAIEGSVVGPQILELVEKVDWTGTATELLEELHRDSLMTRQLPRTASSLSGKLRRLAPSLREFGIQVDFDRTGHRGIRTIRITKDRQESVSGVSTAA